MTATPTSTPKMSVIESFRDLCLRVGAPEPCAFVGDPAIGRNSSWLSVVGTYRSRDRRSIDVSASWSTVTAPLGDYIVWTPISGDTP